MLVPDADVAMTAKARAGPRDGVTKPRWAMQRMAGVVIYNPFGVKQSMEQAGAAETVATS